MDGWMKNRSRKIVDEKHIYIKRKKKTHASIDLTNFLVKNFNFSFRDTKIKRTVALDLTEKYIHKIYKKRNVNIYLKKKKHV
jgi:hypothetical protein